MVNSTQPNKVRKGITLLIAALIVGILNNILTHFMLKDELSSEGSSSIMTTLLSTALGAFFIYSISQRKNWARITMAVLAGIGALIMLFALAFVFKMSPLLGILSLVGLILNIAGLVMLFSQEANAWFKSNTTNPPTQF